MKRGESFRERWRGSNKNFTLNNNNNNNTVDFRQDDELDQTGDTDGALSRRSSLRRSFSRKIRKYVKYEGGGGGGGGGGEILKIFISDKFRFKSLEEGLV